MDHPALVGVVHRVGNLPKQRQAETQFLAGDGLRPLREESAQGVATNKLHGEEVLAVLGAPRLVDGGDVGVLEAGKGVRLALEHPDASVVDEMPATHDLDGDLPAGALLLGLVDHAHAPFAELAEDAVAADGQRR